MKSPNNKVTIIGTGSFGLSLGKRLIDSGYEVIFGSRNPNQKYIAKYFEQNNLDEKNFSLMSINQAWNNTDCIVFLAISSEDKIYENFVNEIRSSNKNRIVVDISNIENEPSNRLSNAERLNDLLKKANLSESSVIKGFNLITAYSVGISRFEQKSIFNENSLTTIPICGDDTKAKEKVANLCKSIGFRVSDIGDLTKAFKLERMNINSFNDWQYPSILSSLFLLLNWIWIFIHYYVFPKKQQTFENYLKNFSVLGHTNKVLGFTALQLLALVYFGSCIAAILQLKNRTKYMLFPRCINNFLMSRKQYGLWAFLYACIHAIMSIYVANPGYLKDWYVKTSKEQFEYTQMSLIGEFNLIFGIISFILFVLVALSSINSIAQSLNWKEWNFVQTKLGIACLTVGFLHAMLMYMNTFIQRNIHNYDILYLATRVKLIATFFPFLVLLLRFIFAYFPFISKRLMDIRKGKLQHSTKSKTS